MTGYQSKKKATLDKLAQPEQKPVEDVMLYQDDGIRIVRIAAQPTWVGLTDEEIALIDWESLVTKKDCVQAVEAKLKEKNA
jgi:hypothetical protein